MDFTTCTLDELWHIARTLWYYMDADQRQEWQHAKDAIEAEQLRKVKAKCHAQAAF